MDYLIPDLIRLHQNFLKDMDIPYKKEIFQKLIQPHISWTAGGVRYFLLLAVAVYLLFRRLNRLFH